MLQTLITVTYGFFFDNLAETKKHVFFQYKKVLSYESTFDCQIKIDLAL